MWMSLETAYGEVLSVPLLKSVTGTSQISWCALVGLSFLPPALPLPIAQDHTITPPSVCVFMYAYLCFGISEQLCGDGGREVWFGWSGGLVGVKLCLHTRHAVHHHQHLVKHICCQHLGKGGRERREFYGFSEQRSNCTSKPLGSGSNLRAVPLITTFSENPENIPAHFSPYTHTLEHHILITSWTPSHLQRAEDM